MSIIRSNVSPRLLRRISDISCMLSWISPTLPSNILSFNIKFNRYRVIISIVVDIIMKIEQYMIDLVKTVQNPKSIMNEEENPAYISLLFKCFVKLSERTPYTSSGTDTNHCKYEEYIFLENRCYKKRNCTSPHCAAGVRTLQK